MRRFKRGRKQTIAGATIVSLLFTSVCREGHWRHGVYCYVIMEASFDQAQAKNWCSESRQREGEASLAIIKDKFAQVRDFFPRFDLHNV